jgi:hypothetical protein
MMNELEIALLNSAADRISKTLANAGFEVDTEIERERLIHVYGTMRSALEEWCKSRPVFHYQLFHHSSSADLIVPYT